MYEEQVSKLRVITDVFINPQVSDALSNAMLESLYTGALVLNGSWLKYSILDESGIVYYKYDSIEALGKALCSIIDCYESKKKETLFNKKKVYEISSWEYLRKKWLQLYS